MSERRRRLHELFVEGREVSLTDGTYLWVQVLNPFERDEAISAAQIARARLVLALKANGEERMKIEAKFETDGKLELSEGLAARVADGKSSAIAAEIEDDQEWSERIRILHETDFTSSARDPLPEEQALLEQITIDYYTEIDRRMAAERSSLAESYRIMPDNEFVDVYLDQWLELRSSEVASAEYQLVEMFFATRFCNAVKVAGGIFDHSRCDNHPEHVFEKKSDVRTAPEKLLLLLRDAITNLNMSIRDPKGLGSPPSSSDSSPPLSEEEELILSSSPGIPEEVLGISA